MKHLTLLFFVLIVLSSCSNDDGDSQFSGDLVGAWVGTELTYQGTAESSLQGFPITTNFEGEAYDMTSTITFNESPNTVVSEGAYSLKFTYNFNGVSKTEFIEDVQFLENGTWEVDGNTLIINNNGQESMADILFLTEDKLVVEINQVEETEVDGLTVIATIKSIATFKR
ncbi:lipocalin family protein [Pseudotamlana carrageenivorans]|uniref:Lipocalin-like domain-containing protein n=1 Tax=Pseudotamlana carrageenivorans TaxID=2069432 RepID=A0A2I7SM95_9FLAO|nr:lipocalin family protein [Tamlana carrageenivorans]AUS07021.1 hypothetical protein C1A40_16915 [Tamlana carrageenivorans]